jgi:hypothetical protein
MVPPPEGEFRDLPGSAAADGVGAKFRDATPLAANSLLRVEIWLKLPECLSKHSPFYGQPADGRRERRARRRMDANTAKLQGPPRKLGVGHDLPDITCR